MKPDASNEKRSIGLNEAAELLGVSYQEAYSLARAGSFECVQYRQGGRIRTTREAVLAFIEKSKIRATETPTDEPPKRGGKAR